MNQDTSGERRAKAAGQAAQWLVAIQSEELSSQERADFIDWLRESPLHVSEMLHACRLHRDLRAFHKWDEIAAAGDQDSGRVVDLLTRQQPGDSQIPESVERAGNARRTVGIAVAAAAAAGAVYAVIAAVSFGQTTLRTQLAERREVTLSDGSVVDLAPSSEVRVRYRAHSRSVILDRGQALFHVARNPGRPFTVEASGTQVRAVGTVFDVERTEQSVSVTVVEGRVTVTEQPDPRDSGGASPEQSTDVSLGADEQIVISATGGLNTVHKVRGEVAIAWTAGQLIFDNESVAEIARRFNLYNRTQIVLLDQNLAARRISGQFRATDPESFVAFVQSAGGVYVERPSTEQIILGRAVPGTAAPARP
jgi:transmembrane sensor